MISYYIFVHASIMLLFALLAFGIIWEVTKNKTIKERKKTIIQFAIGAIILFLIAYLTR